MKPARRSRPACSALLLADVFDFRVSSLETRKAQPQAENTRIGQRATWSQRKPLEVAVSHPLHALEEWAPIRLAPFVHAC